MYSQDVLLSETLYWILELNIRLFIHRLNIRLVSCYSVPQVYESKYTISCCKGCTGVPDYILFFFSFVSTISPDSILKVLLAKCWCLWRFEMTRFSCAIWYILCISSEIFIFGCIWYFWDNFQFFLDLPSLQVSFVEKF